MLEPGEKANFELGFLHFFLLATTTPACGSASITNGFECGCQEAKICDHSLIDIRDLVVSGPDGHWTIDQRSLN